MIPKRELLIWVMVFLLMSASLAWAGCGASEPEVATEPEITTEPLKPSQWPRGEDFVPRKTGILSMLAATEDKMIDTAVQEAVGDGRITREQAIDLRIWWALCPEVLSPDAFPRQMPDNNLIPTEPPQQWQREGFIPRATGVLTILAATEDELIDTALQEAVDDGRITEKQADEIRDW